MTDLSTVRLGTAYFLRAMSGLTDAGLSAPSRLPGWSRRHVLAHVGYNARALARLVNWAATGIEQPMYASPQARNQEIESGATLSPVALRHLVDHSAIHLDVEWRDLPTDSWSYEVVTAQGRTIPVCGTIWLRTREVWVHAIDLDCGQSFSELPDEVLRGLLRDVTTAWQARGQLDGIRLISTSTTDLDIGDTTLSAHDALRAPTHELAAWALGRSDGAAPDWAYRRPAPTWI